MEMPRLVSTPSLNGGTADINGPVALRQCRNYFSRPQETCEAAEVPVGEKLEAICDDVSLVVVTLVLIGMRLHEMSHTRSVLSGAVPAAARIAIAAVLSQGPAKGRAPALHPVYLYGLAIGRGYY